MHSPFLSQLAQAWPYPQWRDSHVLVAVSGGADSVALLRGLVSLKSGTPGSGTIYAAHFNHGMRGAEADGDEAWVGQLCEQLGVELQSARTDEPLSSEEAARDARYQFLVTRAHNVGARFIATAHTANDQVETVLMRVLRGSGIDGLAGIPAARAVSESVTLVRPMLSVCRASIESYLVDIEQSYRTDTTNAESCFTRNWVRNELLPQLRERLPGDVDQALRRLASQAGEWRSSVEQVATPLAESAFRVDAADCLVATTNAFCDVPAILAQQACRLAWRGMGWGEAQMGQCEWQRLASALREPCDPFVLPGGVDVRYREGEVVLSPPVARRSSC